MLSMCVFILSSRGSSFSMSDLMRRGGDEVPFANERCEEGVAGEIGAVHFQKEVRQQKFIVGKEELALHVQQRNAVGEVVRKIGSKVEHLLALILERGKLRQDICEDGGNLSCI